MKKSHLIFIPSPGMGHLMPAVEFAKLLVNHHERLTITLLIISHPSDPYLEAYTHSLTSSLSSPQRLHFILLPMKPDPTDSHSLHPSAILASRIENQKHNVKDAVSKLITQPYSPRLAAFVVDVFCTPMIDVATEFGFPTMVFFTSGAAFLGFKLHTFILWEQHNVDMTEFKFVDSSFEFSIPSFQSLVPVNVFPGISLDKEWKQFFFNHTRRLLKETKGIIVNTFEELESHAMQSLSDYTVYPIGPLLSSEKNKKVKETEGFEVMTWLDDQDPSSFLFICFGSRAYFEDGDQVKEIATALERSGVHFVWSLRKPPPEGPMQPPNDYSNLEEVLPEGFLERTCEKGRVMGWAPQAQILAHRAVGGFMSHCGWNSILESVYNGVPIATWPHDAEQNLNAFQLVRELKMGAEISLEYRRKVSSVVSAERIEKGIRQVMEKDSEVRKNVQKMSEIGKKALVEGGSSYSHLRRFITDLLNEN